MTRHAPPLIGLAHGSRDPRAARTVAELMRAVQRLRPGLLAVPAFLDLSVPDLRTAVARLRAEHGVDEAIVLPLLFTEAFHATVDTPTAAREAQDATGVSVRLGGILGTGDEVMRALQDAADRAHIGIHEAIVLLAVGSSEQRANDAVHLLADRWSDHRVGPVWAGFATAEPRAADVLQRAAASGRRVGIVPLFVAPGLLLDAIAEQALALDAEIAQPLGISLAELVLQRYDETLVTAAP